MRLLLACSLGGSGHLDPLLPLADAAARRGDDVVVVVPPALEASARASGHAVRVGAEPPAEAVARIRDLLVSAPSAEAAVLGDRELFGRLATAAMLPAMQATCAEWRPDLILREPCEYSSAVVAERTAVRYAHVAISLADIEASVAPLVAPVLDGYIDGLTGRLSAAPYLTRFPASLDPSPWSDTRRYGAEAARQATGPPPAGWQGDGPARVYLTLGSVTGHMAIARDAYRAVLDGVADLDVRVLMTVGRHFDVATLGPVPAHVRVEAWVPQAEVLAHADLVIGHGGSGTTLGALAAGVPLVVFPLFADQFTNGRRVADAGAGLTVEPPGGRPRRTAGPADSAALAAAVASALSDRTYTQRAAVVAEEMAGYPSPAARLAELAAGS